MRVSILVLVDLAREYLQYSQRKLSNNVSILVLVDLAREFSNCHAVDPEEFSFNPCFSGSCSRISYLFCFLQEKDVSILVLVDLARE